jgi:hypothetical protein
VGLLDDLGTVVATSALVSGDDGPWVEGRDGVEGGDPLAAALGAGLTKVLMDVVVDGVAVRRSPSFGANPYPHLFRVIRTTFWRGMVVSGTIVRCKERFSWTC